MTILSGIPVLHCRSIETTLEFYQQLLQFVVVKKRDVEDALHWVHLMHGDSTLMLQVMPDDSPSSVSGTNSNITLYYFVNNIDDMHHFIKAKNTNVSALKETDYQMREFSITDPEGNMITFGMTTK